MARRGNKSNDVKNTKKEITENKVNNNGNNIEHKKEKKQNTFNTLDEFVAALKDACEKNVSKWGSLVKKQSKFKAQINELIKGNYNVLFPFIEQISITTGKDASGIDILNLAALYGEPEILKIILSYSLQLAPSTSYLTDAARGRVTPSKVEQFLVILSSSPKIWEPAKAENFKSAFEAALSAENYSFYAHLCKIAGFYYTAPLQKMEDPNHRLEAFHHKDDFQYHSQQEEKTEIAEPSILSLKQMCLSTIKMRAICETEYRKEMKNKMSRELLQLFLDCLPEDANSARLLDFFTGTPGITVDVRQHYWALYEQENKLFDLRQYCYGETKINYDRFARILSVYDNEHKFQHPPKDKYDEEGTVLKIFNNYRPFSGPSIVNEQVFKQQFNEMTRNLFDGADWSNMVVIGGAVVGSIMPKIKGQPNAFRTSDIDVFFYNVTREHFKDRVFDLITFIKNKYKDILILVTEESVTICLQYPNRRIQINLGLWRSIESIIMDVDIDCTGLAFDGTKVWASPRAVLALNRCWSVMTNLHYTIRGHPKYEERLLKYAHRGFTIVDFNFPADVDIANSIKQYQDKKQNEPRLRIRGVLALLYMQHMNGTVAWEDLFEQHEDDKDLPPISRELTPRRIKAKIDAGKYIYHSYGQRIVAYKSKYRPQSYKFLETKRESLNPEYYRYRHMYGNVVHCDLLH